MDNIPSLGDRLRALPRAVSVSVIVVFCLAVLGGTGYWGSQYYYSRVDTATVDDLGRFIKEGVTVNNCDEMKKYQISRWSRPEKIADILPQYNDTKKNCAFIKADFGSISFFDPEHDFRSTLFINFSVPIDQIIGKPGSEEYKKNELMAKEKMLSQIHFSPEVKMTSDDIVLYGNKVILSVLLESKKTYTIFLQNSVLTSNGESISSWEFTTPENKTLLLRTTEKASLYSTLHPPIMELLAYDTEKSRTKIKVCGLDLENYGKIEILLKNNDIAGTQGTDMISGEVAIPTGKLSFQKEFFRSGIDAIKTTGCQEIPVAITGDTGENTPLIKKSIPLEEALKKLGNTGLFMVVFTDIEDRDYNGRIQPPLLFGMINAHTTMKVSQNGEAFFFVNDFAGNPIENIEMSVNVNEFRSKETTYTNGGRSVIQYSPLEKSIYSKTIPLGKTNKDGILKTNLKGKINDYFVKTFENKYEFDESGTYPSFFVTGSSPNTLSYVSSQWNGGIAPWNFGYSINSWFDSSANLNGDNLGLNQWIGDDLPFVAHIFTDRVLYLPGETVSIKAIIRNSLDLSSPKNAKFSVVMRDDQGKEVKRTIVNTNEFGSVIDTFVLDKKIPLGAYSVTLLSSDDTEIGWTGFSVEVFKNPKFTTDITLTTTGMNGEHVTIASKGLEQKYMNTEYRGKFTLNAQLIGRYYSGGTLGNVPFDYKVYRQEYYDTTYWNDCYYGCFWEANKEFYTEGSATFDANGGASLTIPVDFTSLYSDYRYIVEVTPRDTTGDVVSSTNSLIARLPAEYKRWDPNTSIVFQTEKRFYPAQTPVHIRGKLNHGTWDESHENKYLLIVKKKSFEVTEVADVRGFKRPVSKPIEELVEIIPVSKNRFQIDKDGTVNINYILPETAEYIFEFGTLDAQQLRFDDITPEELITEFNTTKSTSLNKKVSIKVDHTTDFWALSNRCIGGEEVCSRDAIVKNTGCDLISGEVCLQKGHTLSMNQKIDVSDLIMGRQFFSLLTYSDSPAKNPEISDNKIQVLSEKVSYKIGEKARILIRLPFTNGKILWTVEKRGVEKSEYIDVPGNVFFKEVTVDESFTPNAYISVIAIDTSTEKIPEYKVGYTEIVVDKTDKKSSVTISADKKIYAPREKVTLSMQVKDANNQGKKSELAVMVIDDSLISLMGNIDTNTLEKIWKKLPFQIQTSITNIAMLKNYYFARPGIVGGSGEGNNKGGDSAKSTRTLFKNTAYYNGRVMTDASGIAKIDFTLPDNLTQFRVIVLSNSLDSTFGSGETIFSVQKPVTLEDKTPLILRDNDHIILGANLFNQTGKDMTFTVDIKSDILSIQEKQKKITLKNGENAFVSFDVKNQKGASDIVYTMTATGDSPRNSDSLEGHIAVAQSPTLLQRVNRDDMLSSAARDYTVSMPENTLLEKSTYEVSLSNNPLQHLESILSSLLIYPYGCIEQSTSTTLPNVMAQKFAKYFTQSNIDLKKAEEQTKVGLARIASMQTESGGFAYWEGSNDADLHITPYVLRSLLSMRDMGAAVDQMMIDKATDYLLTSLPNAQDNTEKVEIFFALARAGKGKIAYDMYFGNTNIVKDLTRHEKIAYTYALILTDKTAYAKSIRETIETIKSIFETPVLDENYWYWDETSDKAQFASLLMDMNYDITYITGLIKELSDKDYMSYYMSTQSKNATFGAFIKYIEKYGKNQKTQVQVTLNNKIQNITLTGDGGRFVSKSPLSDVLKDGKVGLSVKNDSKTPVFVSVRLNAYPADIKKVKKYENGIKLTRTISEVIDTKKLAECSGYYYYDTPKDCDKAFKTVTGDVFKKGTTYKITLKADFTDNKGVSFARRNMTLEDYLPATFRVMNSKFRTNSIATNQNTTQGWYYNHVEVLPNLIMAYAENVWGDTAEYSYFVIPEFEGTFLYPPATAYLMYNPDIRAYGEFRTIEVK